MNLITFDDVAADIDRQGKCLGQDRVEFKRFLEYAGDYFSSFGIIRPVVVEIGTLDGAQKPFYERLLGAEHISIDAGWQAHQGKPDILGDSADPATLAALQKRLAGRDVDLLFIDGDHSFHYALSDWRIFGPLSRHLVAFHDVMGDDGHPGLDVEKAWELIKIQERERGWHFEVFHHRRRHEQTTIWPGHEMGIGLIVKGGRP